jgi:protein translocase SecG subunit
MIIPTLQIIISVALIILILVQERSSGLSGILGGGGEVYSQRRGLEKGFFGLTVVLVIVFAVLSLLNFVF